MGGYCCVIYICQRTNYFCTIRIYNNFGRPEFCILWISSNCLFINWGKKKKKSGLCPKQLGRTRISYMVYVEKAKKLRTYVRREMMKLRGFPMEEGKHLNSSLKDEPNSAGYSVETASYELYIWNVVIKGTTLAIWMRSSFFYML